MDLTQSYGWKNYKIAQVDCLEAPKPFLENFY